MTRLHNLPQPKGKFTEIPWHMVQEKIININPELSKIINQLNIGKEFTLFEAEYPFGTTILKQGRLHIPNEQGNIVPIDDSTIPSTIRHRLTYNPVPLSLVLENNTEGYIDIETHSTPFALLTPGDIFGSWELFDLPILKPQSSNWSFNAGARSIFMLPKISSSNAHLKLRSKYGVSPYPPKDTHAHFQIFNTLANHKDFSQPWRNKLIFFPIEWIQQQDNPNNPAWTLFFHYLLKKAWRESLHLRTHMTFELIWHSLTSELDKRNLKPKRYLIDTLKHLLGISIGALPGFAPATNSQIAPIDGIQQSYTNVYGLQQYIPTIMVPSKLSISEETMPVYYSMQHPSILAYLDQIFTTRSTFRDLQDIKYLMEMLLTKLKRDKKSIYALLEHIKFDYFHTEKDPSGEIRPTTDIFKGDDRFLKIAGKKDSRNFAYSASFLRGCIRISKA